MRRRALTRIALILCAAALATGVSGCKSSMHLFDDSGEGGFFSKPLEVFGKPDWAVATSGDMSAPLSPTRPVVPEELVSADGRCAAIAAPAPSAAAAPPPPPPDRPVGSIAGDLAQAPMPAATYATAQPGGPPIMGGVALGMSECEVVRRAGTPSNVDIHGGERGGRQVVLTYLGGQWPGIYTFDSGRLKVVDRAPEQPAPVQEPPKSKKAKKKPLKPKTATREIDRAYVQ